MGNRAYGRIYMIVNLINGKRYVGQTTQTISQRFYQHTMAAKHENHKNFNTLISRAIRKHGVQNFVYGEICVAHSRKELNCLESKYINEYITADLKNGYNVQKIDLNGNYKHSEETKNRIKISHSSVENKQIASNKGKKLRGQSHSCSLSEYVGVSTTRNRRHWVAQHYKEGKQIQIGTYNTEIEAAQARDIAELEYVGHEAILNFPELRNSYLKGETIPQKRILNHNIRSNKKSDSNMVGVFYGKSTDRWWFKMKGCKAKTFKTKEEAEAYAVAHNPNLIK